MFYYSFIFAASAQNNLNGIVTDKNNQPLKGATVIISQKKFKLRTQTDAQGKFSFINLDSNQLIILQLNLLDWKHLIQPSHLKKAVSLNIVLKEMTASLEPLEVTLCACI